MYSIDPFSLTRRSAPACALAVVGAALLLCAPGCRRKAEPQKVVPETAPTAPKSAVQQRMESPEYVAELNAIQSDRKAKAAEATQVRTKMAARVKAFEVENEKAAALRGEIEALRTQIGEKEAALAELVKQDPAYQGLDAEAKKVAAELEAIRVRAVATVGARMQAQVSPRDPASSASAVPPSRRLPTKLSPTNVLEVVRPTVRADRPPVPPKAPIAPAGDPAATGGKAP